LTHETEIDTRGAAQIQPHAHMLLERARKLEALSLTDLTARVADGLARLRLSYGLEMRDADPVRALLAALPRTEIARRSTDLTAELEVARQSILDRERAAAEVDRRSESLKEALRERSADLATALARADEAVSARRELEVVRAETGTVRSELETSSAEREALRGERDALRAELETVRAEREAQLATLAGARRDLADAAGERTRSAAELARSLEGARGLSSALDESRRHAGEIEAERARDRASVNHDLVRLDLARSALAAAEERALSRVRLAEVEREIASDHIAAFESEIGLVRRERDQTIEELRRLQAELEARAAAHRVAITTSERALAESGRDAEPLRRELEWRRREMDAVREAANGLRWKWLGGDAAERIAGWNREGTS